MRALGTMAVAVLMGCQAPDSSPLWSADDPLLDDPEVPVEETSSRISYAGNLPYATPGGLALHPDRVGGFGMMSFGACQVSYFGWGFDVGYEYDFPGEDGVIEDDEGGDVLLVSRGGIIELSPFGTGWGESYLRTPMDRLVSTARLTDDGFAALTSSAADCAVEWIGAADDARISWDGACPSPRGFTVDPASGTAYLTTSAGTHRATRQGLEDWGDGGDLAVWDEVTATLFVSSADGTSLRAVEPDGSERWSSSLAGVVTSMDDIGAGQQIAAVVSLDDGRGELQLLDAWTGAVTGRFALPRADAAVVGAEDGTRLALRRPGSTHFFGISE